MTAFFLITLGVYLACGLAFAVPFVLAGVGRIDPHAARGSWGFRLLIVPGTMALWPLLLRRWVKGVNEPPEQNDAHRHAASGHCGSRREKAHSGIPVSQSLVTSSPTSPT